MIKQRIINIAKKLLPESFRISLRKINWKFRYFIQSITGGSGKNVYCPIARKEFKTFIKVGRNYLTPVNGANGRQRLVWHYLENEVKIFERKMKLLHTAPELSYQKILSGQKNIDYVPGDKMEEGYSNQNGILNIDLTRLDFDDNSFDFVLSNHVLEHIPDDRKAMSEIFRVLKVGGKAIITVPINESLGKTAEDPNITSPAERKKHFGQWDHVRWYGVDIKDRLEDVGFAVRMFKYGEQFSKEDFDRYGFANVYIIEAEKTS